ncbi:GGDEF domain-containing protein [Dactylosporangium vinaceum]|uniref:Diguanylate cyclase n=1 Tax=Dactylosporangium vinaceum TaxID=53362 RepID=A0ABV5LY05_9ACTN|nr:tetratricopeptide repeat-containing diguanylate cyclase [Dactylosporangium vinaceum]UAC00990.1 GGDEF domain-containing protein [Dactylosporangium vinaceum]
MSAGSEVAVAGVGTPARLIRLSRERLAVSDPEGARALAEQARTDPGARAEALSIIATCRRLRDEYPDALAAAQEAAELARAGGDPAVEGRARSEAARALLAAGETSEALQESTAALALAESSGDLAATIPAMAAVSYVYLVMQQFDLAVQLCERGAEMARLVGDELAEGVMLDTGGCATAALAIAARAVGDEETALAHAQDAAERCRSAMLIARRLGHRRNEASAMANLAELLTFAGRAGEGLRLLQSLTLDPDRDSTYTITHHLDTRGQIHLALEQYGEAVAAFTEALERAESKGAALTAAEHLAEAYERCGDPGAALQAFKQFHQLYCQVASETAQRNARVTAVRMETELAKATAEQERRRADGLLRISREDPLTALANRRRLDDELAGGVEGHAIALIDVDHFKQVNDRYSHQTGDEVLRTLAALLRTGCRTGDTAARYGGEEFAVLFRDLPDAEAVEAAARIRHLVEQYPWSTVAPGLTITVSIGVASGPDLLALADLRLYQAKHAGRNRVVGPPDPGVTDRAA